MKDIKEIIKGIIHDALQKLNYQFDKEKIVLERTKQESHGDWATNVALQLASVAKKSPRQIAEEIRENSRWCSCNRGDRW